MQYHELRGKLGLEPFEPRDTPPLVNFMPNWEISNRLLFAEVIALADEWIWDWRNLAKRMGMRGARLAGDCQHPHTLYVQTTSKSSRKRHGLSAVGSLPLEPQPLLAWFWLWNWDVLALPLALDRKTIRTPTITTWWTPTRAIITINSSGMFMGHSMSFGICCFISFFEPARVKGHLLRCCLVFGNDSALLQPTKNHLKWRCLSI